jgi:acetylornithine aminotransferase
MEVMTKTEEACLTDAVMKSAQDCLVNNYGQRSIVATHGSGNYLFDSEGHQYLDFAAGIAVNCLGHCEPGWVDAVAKQAGTLVHTSNMFLNAPQVQLAERLVASSFADKAFFANSGTEANEGAIKFARKFHVAQGQPRERLVAFENSFHGRTMGALSLTWKEKYRTPFAPLMPSADFLPYNDVNAVAAIDETVCAVFVEPVQGEGGCIPGDSEFLAALRSRCDAVGALLVFDEVQCGLGRTGKLFAYEHVGVVPDIVTLAKPLAAGLPIGACLMSDKVAKVIEPGDHGSTFAGGPLVCAAANYTFDRLSNEAFLANVDAMGHRLREGLRSIVTPYGCEVRGVGLLNGIVCPSAQIVTAVQSVARENGLLVLTAGAGDVIRLVPSLTVTAGEVDECLAILKQAFDRVDIPYPSVVGS